MTPPPRPRIEPERERLFNPLHEPWQVKAVLQFDVEREPRIIERKAAYLELEPFLRVEEDTVEKDYRPPQLEHRFADIDLCLDFVPDILF
jgi:hypothetical protein